MKEEGYFDSQLSPRINLSVGNDSLDLVVDTGFNGELILPSKLIRKLGFQFRMRSRAELADGTVVQTSIYSGRIQWFGQERSVQVIETASDDALLGTEMLFGVTLFMDLDEDSVVLEKKDKK